MIRPSLLVLCWLVFAVALTGCAPKIVTVLNGPTTTALPLTTPMLVLNVTDEYPPNAILMASVSVGEAGATLNCGFERVGSLACLQALKCGGNILKITEITPPGLSSSCYQIVADIFFASDLQATASLLQRKKIAAAKSRLPAGTTYSLLYIYRPDYPWGKSTKFDLHLNDSVVYSAQNNSFTVIRLPKPGPAVIWSDTKTTNLLNLEIEPGQEYFLRCGLEGNALSHRPAFQFVSPLQGRDEFEKVSSGL